MNILTHCETNVFFKYFLKKTIFMPRLNLSGGKIAVKYFINGYFILLCVISPKKFLRSV